MMPKRLDLTGRKLNMLTVIGFAGIDKYGKSSWNCKCDCGRNAVIQGSRLTKTKDPLKSCGCLLETRVFEGMRVNKLLVVSRAGSDKSGKTTWNCICDCGSSVVLGSSALLRVDKPRLSCGCSKRLDISGKKFGMLTVVGFHSMNKHKQSLWNCECECGVSVVRRGSIASIGTHCGCMTVSGLRPKERLELIGQRFGRLEVISFSGLSEHGHTLWNCKCDCGNMVARVGTRLRQGTKCCGCDLSNRIGERGRRSLIDISGNKYCRVTVISRCGVNSSGHTTWNCICDCGNSFVTTGGNLKTGRTKSCGCIRAELKSRFLHGASSSPEYGIWQGMKKRCSDINCISYSDYGARGIRVCERWEESFSNFFSDMGLRPSYRYSIERDHNDGDYSPENCRWATKTEQARNTRKTLRLTIGGTTLTVYEWSEISGVSPGAIKSRIRSGMNPIDAVFLD